MTIRVEIDRSKLWTLAQGHPVHINVSVFKTLRDAGIPVDGGIELRGVMHGRLVCFNELRDGKQYYVYEWTRGPESAAFQAAAAIDSEDDEL